MASASQKVEEVNLKDILAVFRAAIRYLSNETGYDAVYMPLEVYPRCMLLDKANKIIAELCYTPITGYRHTINGITVWSNNIMLGDFIAKFWEDVWKIKKGLRGSLCLIIRDVELREIQDAQI